LAPVNEVLPQALETSDPQEPEKSCSIAPELIRLEPILLRVTVTDCVEAIVNINHESSSGLPVAQSTGMPALADILLTVPVVFVTPTVKAVALAHSSLVTGGEELTTLEKKHDNKIATRKAVSLYMVLKRIWT
jgi:hypothetical protein